MRPIYSNTLSVVSILFLLLPGGQALRPYHFTHHSRGTNYKDVENQHVKEGELGMELYPTGSSLPDCSHACGACRPCRRVMVSFNKCAVESCPIVYRCMCNGKYYHVPSN
ncbi:protein EPIDERMAL PATTERNING FACTOR 2-like [Salvia miltiorrhiza]|uniref:protein EPIDERMAL PATTERNING FACTOR 2-like n=1 Tax=Salvia miltiorrhiza TaxID=226208 RepID=UPI0025AC9782|nr:protein EPIDERMAL PATTERNING FACTOR 2-like [Salvia miltiorrhiza]XP_057795904.1 protein EPIDERMAL PATTERNING FACTOR 2-like [Salvia miltiorrhiza]